MCAAAASLRRGPPAAAAGAGRCEGAAMAVYGHFMVPKAVWAVLLHLPQIVFLVGGVLAVRAVAALPEPPLPDLEDTAPAKLALAVLLPHPRPGHAADAPAVDGDINLKDTALVMLTLAVLFLLFHAVLLTIFVWAVALSHRQQHVIAGGVSGSARASPRCPSRRSHRARTPPWPSWRWRSRSSSSSTPCR